MATWSDLANKSDSEGEATMQAQRSNSKRGNDEGSIYKRKDGRWAAAINLGWEGGKHKRKTFYGSTRHEAARKLAAGLRDRDQGLALVPEPQSVSSFLSTWLDAAGPRSVRRHSKDTRNSAASRSTCDRRRSPLASDAPASTGPVLTEAGRRQVADHGEPPPRGTPQGSGPRLTDGPGGAKRSRRREASATTPVGCSVPESRTGKGTLGCCPRRRIGGVIRPGPDNWNEARGVTRLALG